MPTNQQPLPVVHQLRDAIRASGVSLNELGRRTGVSEGQLSRFLRGDRTLTLPAAARVCLYFGLELCPQGERSTGGRKGNGDRASPSGKARTRRNAK
jgi:transcriptional regulator with XRE-family HTH domain